MMFMRSAALNVGMGSGRGLNSKWRNHQLSYAHYFQTKLFFEHLVVQDDEKTQKHVTNVPRPYCPPPCAKIEEDERKVLIARGYILKVIAKQWWREEARSQLREKQMKTAEKSDRRVLVKS